MQGNSEKDESGLNRIFSSEQEKEEYLGNLQKPELEQRLDIAEDPRKRFDGEFQRDYSRIMYASSFRRLQGKMQLLVDSKLIS